MTRMLSGPEISVVNRLTTLRDEMLGFVQQLVRIPTSNPPGENYRECAELIGQKLWEFGYDVTYIEPGDLNSRSSPHPRVNVLARLAGKAQSPVVHFNGHIDVVPAGNGWSVDPFAAVIRNDRIYGRGVTDQKAGIAASIFAVEAIRRSGFKLNGSIEQSTTVDEESGGLAGVAYLAEHGLVTRDSVDYVIITEPLGYDRICLGHRGVYWFELVMRGRTAHGSMPFLGTSAIERMSNFIQAMEQRLKPKLAERTTRMPVEPADARRPSINVNSISGGQSIDSPQTPCVADVCRAIFDRRFLIEESPEQVRNEIFELIEELKHEHEDLACEVNDLLWVYPTLTDERSPLVSCLANAICDTIGRRPSLIASPGTYDQKHFSRIAGIEQCVAYGPGILDLAHKPDEYCEIQHIVDSAKAMAIATIRLLGIASNN